MPNMFEIERFLYLEKVFKILPGNVYWKDIHGRYLGCNNNVLKLLNLESVADVIGKTDHQLLIKSQADAVHEVDMRVMKNNIEETLEEVDYAVIGEPQVYLSTKTPLCDDNGKVIGLLGVSLNITTRKKLEKALQEAKDKTEIANKAKTEFILNMQHDLRTPFFGILGLSNHLYRQENDSEKKEILSDIIASSNGLFNLLNEVIELTTIGFSNSPIVTEILIVEDIIKDIIKLSSAEARHKNLSLNYIGTEMSKIPIVTDKIRLNRIVLNLLSNALKYTNKGHINIVVDIHEEQLLTISVEDTGIGIENDKFDTIFDKFSRLTPSYQGIYPGSGLGLYIVKQYLEDLGGRIEVKSIVGAGSVFTCLIPIKNSFIKSSLN